MSSKKPILLVLSCLWASLGLAAAAILSGFGALDVIGDLILIGPGFLFSAVGIGKPLTDAAHGPPFLTMTGVVGFYGIPAAIGIAVALKGRRLVECIGSSMNPTFLVKARGDTNERQGMSTPEEIVKRALDRDALAELLLGAPDYAYLPTYSPMAEVTDLTILLGVLRNENLGYSQAEVRSRLEKAVKTIVTEYEGIIPVATVLLLEALHQSKGRPSFELPLEPIAEDLRRSIDRFRFRLIQDRTGDGWQYLDGSLGELRRLSKITEELGGPKFA